MSEMMDRVAQAMDKAGEKFVADNPDGSNDSLMAALARAVIEAQREPTEAMLKSAMAPYAHDIDDKMRAAFRATIVKYWQAMIDEALR